MKTELIAPVKSTVGSYNFTRVCNLLNTECCRKVRTQSQADSAVTSNY